MCDMVAGELLVSFHQDDTAARDLMNQIRERQITHVTFLEDLGERIARMELPMRETSLRFCRLGVPPGDEIYKINYLQFYYKHALYAALDDRRLSFDSDVVKWSNLHLLVVPNSILSVRQRAGVGFKLSQTHDDYKKLCGWQPTAPVSTKRVVVLDTGLDPASASKVVSSFNFIDHNPQHDVFDDNGHGTAVTEIIHDLCPSAEFVIYKVADKDGRASEWDTLAAMSVQNDADVANLSLSFGLGDDVCPHCGRESHSSRSAVFENMLGQFDQHQSGALVVACAGNDSLTSLSFPARYKNVIAVESLNKAKELSQFTNRSSLDHEGKRHDNVFVLPGGDKQKNVASEHVGTTAAGNEFYGTSFAAAYATGLIAALWSQPAHAAKDRNALLDHLRRNTDAHLPNYHFDTHGHGMMQFQ